MQESLQGKVALITGGSTEVAGAVALELAKNGVNIFLCGKQNDVLELVANRIKDAGGRCSFVESGIGSLEEAESVLSQTLSVYGRLDVLILVSPFWANGGHIHDHSVKIWDMIMDANVRETFLMARAVLPVFREQQRGEIMVIGSDSSMGIYQGDGAYNVAMHALTTLMELIRVENAEFGIRTHILAPGVAGTNDMDAEGKPTLTATHVAEWVLWLLTRPAHLRGNTPILI
jgi:NAD(P)-dependent dehydrogenase (short-subunit alcohol dehydrogenase family)